MTAPRNKTLHISDEDRKTLRREIIKLGNNVSVENILNRMINQDFFDVVKFLPSNFIDLLFIDQNGIVMSVQMFDGYVNRNFSPFSSTQSFGLPSFLYGAMTLRFSITASAQK